MLAGTFVAALFVTFASRRVNSELTKPNTVLQPSSDSSEQSSHIFDPIKAAFGNSFPVATMKVDFAVDPLSPFVVGKLISQPYVVSFDSAFPTR